MRSKQDDEPQGENLEEEKSLGKIWYQTKSFGIIFLVNILVTITHWRAERAPLDFDFYFTLHG